MTKLISTLNHWFEHLDSIGEFTDNDYTIDIITRYVNSTSPEYVVSINLPTYQITVNASYLSISEAQERVIEELQSIMKFDKVLKAHKEYQEITKLV